ncbi:MAG: hypothetical protein ACRDHF_06910, partial [Tepidiformaceae bacterium]
KCADAGYQWSGILRTYYFNPIPFIMDEMPSATEWNQPGDSTWHLNVYVTNGSGQVYEKYKTQGVWLSFWQFMGAPSGGCTSAPASAAFGQSNLWIFCRGQTGAIWSRRYNGSSWGAWQQISPTSMQSGPGATEFWYSGSGAWHINVEAVGWDGALWHNYYSTATGTWSGWESLGSPSGGCKGTPSTDNGLNPQLFVFCRGTNGQAWYRQWNGSGWLGWTSLGGSVMTAAGATDYYQPGDNWHFNVYANWAAGSISERYWSPSFPSFAGWQYQGGTCQSAAQPTNYSTVDLEVFCRWANSGDVWFQVWNGSSWSGWNYTIYQP